MADYGIVKGPDGLPIGDYRGRKEDEEVIGVTGYEGSDRSVREKPELSERPKPRTSTSIPIELGIGVDDLVRAIIDAQNHNGGPVTLEVIRGNASTGEYTLIFERVE